MSMTPATGSPNSRVVIISTSDTARPSRCVAGCWRKAVAPGNSAPHCDAHFANDANCRQDFGSSAPARNGTGSRSPMALLGSHQIGDRTWGVLRVRQGSLRFVLSGEPDIDFLLDPNTAQPIPPGVLHRSRAFRKRAFHHRLLCRGPLGHTCRLLRRTRDLRDDVPVNGASESRGRSGVLGGPGVLRVRRHHRRGLPPDGLQRRMTARSTASESMTGLTTPWSRSLGLSAPIVNAPMGGVAGGKTGGRSDSGWRTGHDRGRQCRLPGTPRT